MNQKKETLEKEKESLNKSDAVALKGREAQLTKELEAHDKILADKKSFLAAKEAQYRDVTNQIKEEENRKYIRENFTTCKKGKFDYCYAFLEKGVGLLAPGGKMVQLIPSNIYKNVFADKLRKKLLPGVSTVWEYPNSPLFENTLTSSSILMYEREGRYSNH